MRMTRDHAGIAGQFLVVAEPARGEMHERVEPEQAAQDRDEGIRQQVAAGDVLALVRQHQAALDRVVARHGIGRHHDARVPDADRRRQARDRVGQQQAIATLRDVAEPAHEAALLPRQERGERHATAQPCDAGPRRDVRHGAGWRFRGQHPDRRADRGKRRGWRIRFGGRQQGGKQGDGHRAPCRMARPGAERGAQRLAQRQHGKRRRAAVQGRLDQPRIQVSDRHRRAPPAICAARQCPCGSACAAR